MQHFNTFSHDLNLFQHISLCKSRAEASMSNVEYGFEVVPLTDKSQKQVAGVGTSRGRGKSEKGICYICTSSIHSLERD